MRRDEMLQQLESFSYSWDVIIIGGGATGLGAAVDACSRGLKTLLVERHDFAKGTSSRSTKLIHGGLRYLKQGNIGLVVEALRERGLLCQNAPHLIAHRPFLVPSYHWWEGPFYGIGVKVYDMLAGKLGLEPSMHLTREETLRRLPNLEEKELKGGVIYYDGQFDDARLAVTLAQTAADLGGCLINYMEATEMLYEKGHLNGIRAKDHETGREYEIHGAAVINATGVFTDSVRRLDDPSALPIIHPSQGIHLVLDKKFMPSDCAILIPHTKDGRVLFMVPWHDKILLGTTDIPLNDIPLEPRATDEEIDFLLQHAKHYLHKAPLRQDVLSIFAGIRPLVSKHHEKKTSAIARDHQILVSPSGLITIAGGKWTTYRKMGEDVIEKALIVGSLPHRSSKTAELKLHGYLAEIDPEDPWSAYGSDRTALRLLIKEKKEYSEPLHHALPFLKGEVVWAVRHEMARSVEDVLARRIRALFLNAKASVEIAPVVAELMAEELKYDRPWTENQIKQFAALAKNYSIS